MKKEDYLPDNSGVIKDPITLSEEIHFGPAVFKVTFQEKLAIIPGSGGKNIVRLFDG